MTQQREVRKRATQIRREILFYILWVSLFSIVLSSFTLEDCFQLSSKVRDEVLGVAGDHFWWSWGLFEIIFGRLGDRFGGLGASWVGLGWSWGALRVCRAGLGWFWGFLMRS